MTWRNALSGISALGLLVAVRAEHAQAQGPDSREFFQDVIAENRFFTNTDSPPIIRLRTRQPAALDLMVYDSGNRPVAYQTSGMQEGVCAFTLTNLPPTPDGLYFFGVVATDAKGNRLALYPANPGGGETIKITDSRIDVEKKAVVYLLPRASFVRIRAGFRDGSYLQPIQKWRPEPAGRHSFAWDGSCQDGIFKGLLDHPELRVVVTAVSLPVNALVNGSITNRIRRSDRNAASVVLSSRLSDLASPPWARKDASHAEPLTMVRDDYGVVLELENDAASRILNIRVNCSPEDRPRLLNKRFEIMVFMDLAYVSEDEVGVLPFNYRISTRGITPGRHTVTANVIDADGNLGVACREFEIGSGEVKR